MNRLFTILIFLACTVCMNAQEKKTWDFTQGLSEETIENLNADTQNWVENGTDADGNVNNWKNNVKPDANSPLMANGVVIPETAGLLFDIGNNKSNSIHLATTKLRLTRRGTTITFPQLVNGQKITIVGRSSNGTAVNRGIAPSYDYIKFVSGTQTDGECIFIGNNVDGSEGTYTFVWEVVTDSPDPVDVKFQLTPEAGIDFTLFMIDEGDAPDVEEEAHSIGYLYSGGVDDDHAYMFLSDDKRFSLTEINVDETVATADSLWNFNGIVISPTIGADNPYLSTIRNTIAYVPILNFNPELYPALGLGKAVPTETKILTVTDLDFGAFEGLDVSEGVELLMAGGVTGVELGDYCANDQIIAIAGDVPAMHIHNAKRNAYMLLPIKLSDMPNVNIDLVAQIIPQTMQALVETKQEVKAVSKPVISVTQENGFATVALYANNSKAIYYTTDGSDPTTESNLYAEPFTLTQNATVKAFAVGDGYIPSEIVFKDVVIITQDDHKIAFADAEVKAICVENWDTNGDGEISEQEAASVTSFGSVFRENVSIISFNELQFFTGLTRIEEKTFMGCFNLISISIPNNVTSIEGYAFGDCSSLTSIIIPNSVTSIGDYAFLDCSNMFSVTIPNSVTSIGNRAFFCCNAITDVYNNSLTPFAISSDNFSKTVYANATLHVMAYLVDTFRELEGWKNFSNIQGDIIDYVLTADALSINLGEKSELSLNLSNSGEVDGLQFDFTLPAGVTVATDEEGEFVVNITNRSSKLFADCVDIGENTFRVILFSTKRAIIASGEGAVVKVGLSCAETATPCENEITFTNISLSCVNEETSVSVKMPKFTTPLSIVEVSRILGDADGDFEINIADVMFIVNHILNRYNSKFIFANADIDGNGEINVADAMNVVNIILHKQVTNVPANAQKTDFDLLQMDGTATGCRLHIANNSPALTAIGMTVGLPDGCRLAASQLTGKASRTHQVMTMPFSNNCYKVVVVSMTGATFNIGEDFLDLSLEGKGGWVNVKDIQCVDTSLETLLSSELNAAVTGIDSIVSDGEDVEPVYNVNGQRMSTLLKGLNISKGRKVVVKY